MLLCSFSSWLTALLNACPIYFKITWALAILLDHMHKKFEINRTKVKGNCQSRRKVVTQNSKSDLALVSTYIDISRLPAYLFVKQFAALLHWKCENIIMFFPTQPTIFINKCREARPGLNNLWIVHRRMSQTYCCPYRLTDSKSS